MIQDYYSKFKKFMNQFIATSVRENIDDDDFVRVDEGSSY